MKSHIKHFFAAASYSFNGLSQTLKDEIAFQQELVILLILIPVSFYFEVTPLERALMLASWLLVMVVELLNAAIESVVDRVGKEQHELSGLAKDQGSAAVMLAIVIAVIVWLAILL